MPRLSVARRGARCAVAARRFPKVLKRIRRDDVPLHASSVPEAAKRPRPNPARAEQGRRPPRIAGPPPGPAIWLGAAWRGPPDVAGINREVRRPYRHPAARRRAALVARGLGGSRASARCIARHVPGRLGCRAAWGRDERCSGEHAEETIQIGHFRRCSLPSRSPAFTHSTSECSFSFRMRGGARRAFPRPARLIAKRPAPEARVFLVLAIVRTCLSPRLGITRDARTSLARIPAQPVQELRRRSARSSVPAAPSRARRRRCRARRGFRPSAPPPRPPEAPRSPCGPRWPPP